MLGMMMQKKKKKSTIGSYDANILWGVSLQSCQFDLCQKTQTLVLILALVIQILFCYSVISSSVLPFNAVKPLACSPISLSSVLPRYRYEEAALCVGGKLVSIHLAEHNLLFLWYSGEGILLCLLYAVFYVGGAGEVLVCLIFPFILIFP